jgi:hypothetical protein
VFTPADGIGFLPATGMDYLAHLIKNTVFILIAMRVVAVVIIVFAGYRLLQHIHIGRWFRGLHK